MDGFAAAGAIRHLDGTLAWPVPVLVAMTANAMRGDRERCLAAGMHDYVSKPVSRDVLFSVLERHLVQGHAASGHATFAPADPSPRSAELAELGMLVHALSNAAQGEDAEALRRRAAALTVFARRVGDLPLAQAARELTLAVPSSEPQWDQVMIGVRRVVLAAQEAQGRLAGASAVA
jgi:CheY-like chemotaxis protein